MVFSFFSFLISFFFSFDLSTIFTLFMHFFSGIFEFIFIGIYTPEKGVEVLQRDLAIQVFIRMLAKSLWAQHSGSYIVAFTLFCKFILFFFFIFLFLVFSLIIWGLFSKKDYILKYKQIFSIYFLFSFVSSLFFFFLLAVNKTHNLLELPFNGYFLNNLLSVSDFVLFTAGILCFSTAIFFAFSFLFFLYSNKIFNFEYLHTIMLALFFLLVLNFSNNFVLTIMCIEALSFCLYYLSIANKNCFFSLEAGMKYFVLGGYSSGLLIAGASLLHISFLSSNFNEIMAVLTSNVPFYYRFSMQSYYSLLDIVFNGQHNYIFSLFVLVGFLFFIIGFLFKIGAAPFHFWVSDVYEGSPMPTTFFFSTVVKVGIFFHLIKLLSFVFKAFIFFWGPFFQLIGIYSLLFGAFSMYKQMKIKRFFAFSSITHTGFILIILSTGTLESISYSIFYLLGYLLLNLMLFGILLSFYSKNTLQKELLYFTDLLRTTERPFLFTFLMQGALISILFSFAGIPPFWGFFMKFNAFVVLFQFTNVSALVFLVMIFASLLSAYNYLKIVKLLLLENSQIKYTNIASFLLVDRSYLFMVYTYLLFLLWWNIFCFLGFNFLYPFLFSLAYSVKLPLFSILVS